MASRGILLVSDYGAVGNGTNDDTAAFQAAINAAVTAGADLGIPPPPVGGYWNITSTLNIPTGTPTGLTDLNIIGTSGIGSDIVWAGGNSTSVFKAIGYRNSTISSVRVNVVGGQTGISVWDVGTNASGAGSSGTLTFVNCHVDLGGGINNAAWRINHFSGGTADASCFIWENCTVFGNGRASGSVGLKVEGGNSLVMNWRGGGASLLDKFYTNTGGGGGCVSFKGASCSLNAMDFEYGASDQLSIEDGRFEEGGTLLYVLPGTTHASVSLRNVMCEAYGTIVSPAYALLNIDRPVTLRLDNCRFPDSNITTTGKVVYLGGYSPGVGALIIDGGGYPTSASNINTSTTPGGGAVWTVFRRGAAILNSSGEATSLASTLP